MDLPAFMGGADAGTDADTNASGRSLPDEKLLQVAAAAAAVGLRPQAPAAAPARQSANSAVQNALLRQQLTASEARTETPSGGRVHARRRLPRAASAVAVTPPPNSRRLCGRQRRTEAAHYLCAAAFQIRMALAHRLL